MVGKTSKKGWRNIKLTDELAAMAKNDIQTELGAKVDSLFVEDRIGGSHGVSKRIISEIKLKGSSARTPASLSEQPLLKKAIAKIQKGRVPQAHSKKSNLRDVWADCPVEAKLKTLLPSTIVRRESLAPAVVPAASTLSVNPTKEDFEAMIVSEAEKELIKQKSRKVPEAIPVVTEPVEETVQQLPAEKKVTERKTKAQKVKEKRHQQMLREHEIKRLEKQKRKALQDKAARKALEAEQAKRRETRLLTSAKRVVAEAKGEFTLARGAGGRILESREAVPVEIAESLRRIVPVGDPVLERRQSLLRRRMIEQVPELNAQYKEKLRFARLDAAKARKMIDKDARSRCVLLS